MFVEDLHTAFLREKFKIGEVEIKFHKHYILTKYPEEKMASDNMNQRFHYILVHSLLIKVMPSPRFFRKRIRIIILDI